jgi:hypothetical protein
MNRTQRTPVVPLEAGAGPENPPCPACGEPLFGWLAAEPGLRAPVSRCESCGLAVVGADADAEEALREIDRLADGGQLRIANRAAVAAGVGEAGWAGLERGARYLFTVEAVRRLVARRDQVVRSRRWAPAASLALSWQTLLNSVTLGHDVALGALGRATPSPAAKRWQRRLDGFVSVVLAIPAMIFALPLELVGAAIGRGSVLSLRLELI